MKAKKVVVMLVVAFCFRALPVFSQGVTIYVDAANAGPWDGSEDHPWDTLHKAVDHLAEVNDPAQGGVQGGHTVLVAEGTYTVDTHLTGAHSGLEGARNVFLAGEGTVVVNSSVAGSYSAFHFESANHIAIEGFGLDGTHYVVRLQGSSGDILVENCTLFGSSRQSTIQVESTSSLTVRRSSIRFGTRQRGIRHQSTGILTIEHSVVHHMDTHGICVEGSGTLNLENSIVFANRSYGLEINSESATVNISNTLFYANGAYNAYFSGTGKTYETEADFAELAEHPNMNFTNIIVSNPGFVDLNNNWNFNYFYANSPCLKENSGLDRDIGIYQDPPTVPIVANTYYVNADGGDDSRSPADAQNENTPWLTIGKAAEHAIAGDTVIVKAGVYEENLTEDENFYGDLIIITRGGSGDLPVTYKADGEVLVYRSDHEAFSFVHFRRVGGVVFDGFKLRGPTSRHYWLKSANIYMAESFGNTIMNCVIYENHPNRNDAQKAGIYLWRSPRTKVLDTEVYSCKRHGLNSDSGGLIVERSTFYSNELAGIVIGLSARVLNSAVYDNEIDNIEVIADRYSTTRHPVRIENCVVYGGVGTGINALQEHAMPDIEIMNTVVAGNLTGINEKGTAQIRHSCFHGNQDNLNISGVIYNLESEINNVGDNENNIVADPQFRNMFYADFRLSQDSPCVNAGTSTTELETDMYGNPRLIGPAVDIGVYEMPYSGSIMRFF